ncbi:hypothetical protein UY3_06019 [Chelonia mydas]|uniref:Uncharacterized protein n=1 Tax=Chelonia mydas TaxID=8469 RepID=M7C881_CHEMY|nr:hypothetical protein UY3_06019 [Chelonia mydas]
MPECPGFKACKAYVKCMPRRNPHTSCLKCLGEDHQKDRCAIYEALAGTATAQALEDNKVLQQLLWRVAQGLGIQAEEVVEDADPMVNILPPSGPAYIALPLIKTISDTTKTLWQTPALLPPMAKHKKRCYFVPSKGYEHLYTHPTPDSLMVDAANQCERQGFQGPTPKNQEVKRLDLYERKVCSTGDLQVRISNQ